MFYFAIASVHHSVGAVAILNQMSLPKLKVLSRSQSDLPLEKFQLGIIFIPLSIHLHTSVGIEHSVYRCPPRNIQLKKKLETEESEKIFSTHFA